MEIINKDNRWLLYQDKEIIGIFSNEETAKENKKFFEGNFPRFKKVKEVKQ